MNSDFDFYVPPESHFGNTIGHYKPAQSPHHNSVIISGFPYDEGTKRNGGRVGGAVASTIFRKVLKQRQFYNHSNIAVLDSGDIAPELQLQTAHQLLYQKHRQILQTNPDCVLFSIGGSNDQSYPNARALLETYPNSKIGVINLDAHFDVRPLKQGKAHSGSPFRQMLENPVFSNNSSRFIEFACKGATCSNQHYQYLKSKGAKVYWLEKDIRTFQTSPGHSTLATQAGQLFSLILDQLSSEVDWIFVSFDTDSISSKYMPGVSAPSVVGGLTSSQAIEIMKIAGANPKVRVVDFSEFNPAVESIISSHMLTQMFYAMAMATGGKRAKIEC